MVMYGGGILHVVRFRLSFTIYIRFVHFVDCRALITLLTFTLLLFIRWVTFVHSCRSPRCSPLIDLFVRVRYVPVVTLVVFTDAGDHLRCYTHYHAPYDSTTFHHTPTTPCCCSHSYVTGDLIPSFVHCCPR